MDEDWHAVRQAAYKGRPVEGAEWEKLYCKVVDMNKVQRPPPECESQGKILWKVRDTSEKRDAYYDQTSEQQIESQDAPRLAPWDKTPAESKQWHWMKLCEDRRYGTVLTLRQQAGAEPERLLVLSRKVDFVEYSCLCGKTTVF